MVVWSQAAPSRSSANAPPWPNVGAGAASASSPALRSATASSPSVLCIAGNCTRRDAARRRARTGDLGDPAPRDLVADGCGLARLAQGRLDALARERHAPQPDASGVEDGVADGGGGRQRGRL